MLISDNSIALLGFGLAGMGFGVLSRWIFVDGPRDRSTNVWLDHFQGRLDGYASQIDDLAREARYLKHFSNEQLAEVNRRFSQLGATLEVIDLGPIGARIDAIEAGLDGPINDRFVALETRANTSGLIYAYVPPMSPADEKMVLDALAALARESVTNFSQVDGQAPDDDAGLDEIHDPDCDECDCPGCDGHGEGPRQSPPGGVTIDGVFYHGGQWMPGDALPSAPDF